MNSRKKKILIRRLIILGIVLIALAAIVYVFYRVYTIDNNTNYGDAPEIIFAEESKVKSYVMENDSLKFEMDPETTHFTLKDKNTGKVWYSNPTKWADDKLANIQRNKDFLASTLSIVYSSFGADIEWNNYTYSIQGKNFRILPQEDGSIRVDYTIGQIERVYLFPQAITEERYSAFTDAMGKKNSKVAGKMFSKKDPAKLKADELASLQALYPNIANQVLYVAKSDLTIKQKGELEKYFVDAGYTNEDLETDNLNLIQQEQSVNGPVFNVSVIYSLDAETGDFVVNIPYESLRCSTSAPLSMISVLPMFGAADLTQEGYMFVPEGGGSIIRYNNHKIKQATYVTNLYGMDYARITDEAKTENRTALPVFGMGQKDGSFICVIDEGDAFASITADISEKISSYNEVYARYNVIHYDKFKVSGGGTEPFYMYEKSIPDAQIVQRYRFIAGDSYVDMAHSFRSYLTQKYAQELVVSATQDMPVNVELIGAINKVVVKAGLPIDSVIAVTDFDQAGEIMTELQDAGVKDLSVRVTGWANGGVRQEVLTSVKTVRQLGGDKGMEKLIALAKEKDIDLYFDGITCFAYNSGLFEGFVPFSNAARYTTREQVKLYPFDIVTFRQSDWMDAFYLVTPAFAHKCADNLINDLVSHNAAGVAFRDIGRLLSGDYYDKRIVTREEVKNMDIATLKAASDKGLNISVKAGNFYALPYADIMTDMDLSGNSYAILDDDVPFYQIVAHGLKNYTGEPINLAGDYETALLECAEYGSGLNFTFMKSDTMVLQDTAYSCYTSSGYDRWKDEVIPMITTFQETMKGLNTIAICGHGRLDSKVTYTDYENGTRIYVNYDKLDYVADGITVPARSYVRYDMPAAAADITATEGGTENE